MTPCGVIPIRYIDGVAPLFVLPKEVALLPLFYAPVYAKAKVEVTFFQVQWSWPNVPVMVPVGLLLGCVELDGAVFFVAQVLALVIIVLSVFALLMCHATVF